MCGRFTLRASPRLIAETFDLFNMPELAPRYNIAPSQSVAVVREQPDAQGRELAMLKWGLIPSWADDPAIGNRLAVGLCRSVVPGPEQPAHGPAISHQ
jgi:putative SOS response-associated peptidase YedK